MKEVRKLSKKILSVIMVLMLSLSLIPATSAHAETTISFDVLRTAINPGYYFSGALINMGVPLNAGDVDKDTFSAIAQVTEADGSVQGSFGNFAWDPEKEDYLVEENWAKWNILDAYVADENGHKVDTGNYVKLDIEWGTRTEANGSQANRYDVPATRASWYSLKGYHALATVEVKLTQEKDIPGVSDATYVQNEIRHDPLFDAFDLSLEVPGGGKAPFYTPANASADNLRPLIVWFHGTGERYVEMEVNGETVNNAGGNLVGNRALAFADDEFQSIMGGAYVLAPQSTTAGWSAARLNDMEALINQVVAENYIDPDRIYVGGLSMGTGMTTPLITSTTDNSIKFAAAMLVSGGNLNANQCSIIAEKGFPVYLVGAASDGAAFGLPGCYDNLIAAGVDAHLMMYPQGPVFDGEYYFGAHDAWNYVYNNLVEDENGTSIFEWMAEQTNTVVMDLTTDAHLVEENEYIPVKVGFNRTVNGNTAVLNFEFDNSLFDYRSFTAAEGVSVVSASATENGATVVLMAPDYDFKSCGELLLSAKEGVDLALQDNSISVTTQYVVLNDETGEKEERTAFGTVSFTTSDGQQGSGEDGKYTLIDLSNLIDVFGADSSDPQWEEIRRFDYNNNGQIDISDIATMAQQIV